MGAGKSEVARQLTELGAFVIDADQLARGAVAPGSEGHRKVVERFPDVALLDGSIDRPALARIVFSDNAARADLNAIIHPIVRKRMRDREGEARPDQLLVHEAPLLFEAGVDRECDVTVVVVAPKEVRIERVAARNSLDRDEIERRMAAQLDPDRVRELATYTIENDGTLKELHAKVAALYAEKLLP